MRVEYCGPYDAVEVPSLGVTCKRGEPVEIPDEIGTQIIKQKSWKSAAPKAARKEEAK